MRAEHRDIPRIGNSKGECWAGHSLGLRYVCGDGVDADDGHEQDFNEDYFGYSFFVCDAPVIPCNTAAPSLWYEFGDNLGAKSLDGQYIEEIVKVWSSPQGAVSGVETLGGMPFYSISGQHPTWNSLLHLTAWT